MKIDTRQSRWTPLALCGFGLVMFAMLAVLPATAQVALRFDPPELNVEAGVEYTLSVWLDDPIDIRTFEVDVTYPAHMLESMGGDPGPLFSDSGFFIFEVFDHETPGQWHGAAVVMGATDWVTGPGELYRWTFRGLANGSVPINVPFVALYAPDATIIPDVYLDPVIVVDVESQPLGDVKALYR